MLKYRFNPRTPIIVLEVLLEGQGKTKQKIKVALDTGATYMMIPWRTAELLGLKPEVIKEKIELTTASGDELAPLVTIKSVTFLGEKIPNVKAVVHTLPQKSKVDGLLGISFLKYFKFCLDLQEGILELTPKSRNL